ncbi:DNA-repair protein XRCC1-like isoform X3 [Humulus lupulus]|uniref:DNA-repair protein XRCC1-like isoform X3 n=1 Tax=Humulus lupulus TaxID=3486 RepID=UPI002B4012B3|nr:DNA-repair protein XRCC1-like isoform X3 [Humulus lupulus]
MAVKIYRRSGGVRGGSSEASQIGVGEVEQWLVHEFGKVYCLHFQKVLSRCSSAKEKFHSAYDLNSKGSNFNVTTWYNSTYKNDSGNVPTPTFGESESKESPPRRSQKKDGGSHSKATASAVLKNKDSNSAKAHLSPSKLKNWAVDDLDNTISWLESQEEKPEPSEIKKIAAEGILTCLQDAIDALEQKQEVGKITEEWKFVPRVVKELAKLEEMGDNGALISKEDLRRQAVECKRAYEMEFGSLEDDEKKKKPKTNEQKRGERGTGYDSDETIEMTPEEIDLAYNTVSSKLHKY